MRIATKEFKILTYNELNEEAKEKVKQWLLDDDIRCKFFEEDINSYLEEEFRNSDLKVNFSLSSCQGDGLNIEGSVNLYDILPKLESYTNKEIKTLQHYFGKIDTSYTFKSNNEYGYSCKFIDMKYIESCVDDLIEELRYWQYKNIKKELILRFYTDMIDYFEELDKKFEKDGYQYLYEMDEDEASDTCEANEYEFFEDGTFCNKIYAFEM